jgi:GT2 family glycosyltransferase
VADVAVVVATWNRSGRLAQLLDALAAQSLRPDRFEVIVVADPADADTAVVLAAELERGRVALRIVPRGRSWGPATARDAGWRASNAGVVAFTDDDCVPQPGWLEAGLRALRFDPGVIVQGRTEPIPWELDRRGPFSRTVEIRELDPNFQCCNVFYPREVLERVDGFDIAAFERWGGEDSDVAWRAIESGARATFANEALVYHAVNELGPVGKLRVAGRWTNAMLAYVRHGELRRSQFVKGIFWKGTHYHLVRAIAALLLPRRLRFLRAWLIGPYVAGLYGRARAERASLLLAPYYAVHDLIELWAVGRAAVRYRSPML